MHSVISPFAGQSRSDRPCLAAVRFPGRSSRALRRRVLRVAAFAVDPPVT